MDNKVYVVIEEGYYCPNCGAKMKKGEHE